MSEIAQVRLPSGDLIWVRIQAEQAAMGERASGPSDVGLGQRIAPAAEAFQLSGFTQAVHGVVASVRQALDEHAPDSLTVEFGIEIEVKAGAVLSVLAEAGGAAHVTVTASWNRHDAATPRGKEGLEPT